MHALELERHYQHQTAMNEDILQFSKIISHDLQEPIHKIQVFIDSISTDPGTTLSLKGRNMAVKIESAARRLRSLTRSLDEYLTIGSEKTHAKVDLNSSIKDAASRAANFREFSDFDIAVDTMPVIEGYDRQLELMFFHLIDNAIQFRNPSRRLVIKINHVMLDENVFRISKDQYRYAEHLKISIDDNGVGFPDKYKDYVFQLLNKIDSSTAGAGLGLPIVKKVVQNHSGEIRLSSEPGKGTCLEILLPVNLNNGFGNRG
jgi:phosphoserine phosphatase RsbU/P